MPYYAVANGRESGLFESWIDCEKQVKGFKGAVFKKFKTKHEAQDFIAQYHVKDLKQCVKQSLAEVVAQSRNGAVANVAAHIKQESPDYIPLESNYLSTGNIIKKENEESLDESLFFEDREGDRDLIVAMSVLKEYPDPEEVKKEIKPTPMPVRPTQRIKIGRYHYEVDAIGYVHVYIGGHSENIGVWNCSAGYGVYFGPDHPLNVAEAATGRMTRNVGEIEAAIEAIEVAKRNGVLKLCIHTGSVFLLKSVTYWIRKWKQNDWRNQSGKVVQNRRQFEKLDKLLNENIVDVDWYDVRQEANASQKMGAVTDLAQLGNEDYLDQHPNKDDGISMHEYDYFDFF